MKQKILIGIESVGGGAFKHVVYIASKLPKEKFDVTLVYSTKRVEDISRELEILKKSEVTLLQFPLSKQLNFISDTKAFFFITKLISKEKFDIIHAHSSKAGLLFRLAGYFKKVSKIYFTPHCFHFQSKKGLYKIVSVFYERLISRITHKIIISDNEYKEAIENKISNKKKLAVINNAVPFDEIKLEKKIGEIKKEFNIPDNIDFVIGGIGRLEPQKDWVTFIQVAKRLLEKNKNIIFLIVGEGTQREHIKTLINENDLNDKILLTGYIKEIHKIYNIIDVLLSTSLWEGLPYVTLEANLYGKPIVATKAIDKEITHLNTTCSARDISCIVEQINKILKANSTDLLEKKYHKTSFTLFLKKHINLYLI